MDSKSRQSRREHDSRSYRRRQPLARFRLLTTLVVTVVLLSGCSSVEPQATQASREAFIRSHPALTVDIAQAIRQGIVVRGMAPDEALAAVGRPFARTLHSDTNVETWLMKASAFNQAGIPHNATVVRLAFMKGRLVEITGL